MCNTTQAPQGATPNTEVQPTDKEIQVANLNLQLAQTRSNAEYNASIAGQIQRQFDATMRQTLCRVNHRTHRLSWQPRQLYHRP